MPSNERLTIAIQKKGRLSEQSFGLLQSAGLNLFPTSSLFYTSTQLPIDILLLRDDDIPNLINLNVCDVGIVGENCLQENEPTPFYFERIKKLGFGQCRLSIAIPKNQSITDINELQNKTIATSYVNLLAQFLNRNKLNACIVKVSGSVEIAPQLNMADAICDLVATGKTLDENNLKEEIVILQSQAVMFKQKNSLTPMKEKILNFLLNNLGEAK